MTSDEPQRIPCDLCGKHVRHSHHHYEGRVIPRYQLFVCKTCYEGNWDGWGPAHEPVLIDHLAKKGLPMPARNEKGYFPRD